MDYIDFIVSMCTTIYKLADNEKANKDRCQRVAQRVKALQELVVTIKQREPDQISATVENALKELCTSLSTANQMMVKYSQTSPVMSFLKSSSHEDKFSKLNERLTDNFQVLSGALQVEHRDMLHKVYESVAGKKWDEESPTSSTTPLPVPSTMSPSPVSSPTAPMLVQSTMYPSPVSSPTAPMPVQSTMSPLQMSSPTTPMPVPYFMSPLQMSSPTAPMPVPYFMSPRPVSSPRAPMPVPYIMSPRPVSFPTAHMCLPGTLNPVRFPTTIVSRPVLRTMASVQAEYTVAPMAVMRPTGPMTISTQNATLVKSYSLN